MIAEPPGTLGLWPLVDAASLGWPDSDEDQARALAEAWRAGARGFATAAEFDAAPAAGFWPDRAGQGFAQRVRTELASAATRGDEMVSLSNRVDHFADVVIGVKGAIRDLILANLDRWAATANLAPGDREDVRASFVNRLAAEVDRLIIDGSEQIGGPLPDPPPPPPPPEPDPLTEVGDFLADAGEQALAVGEAAVRHPELAAGAVLGAGLVVVGAAGEVGGGTLVASGAGAAPGAAVIVGSTELIGAGVALAGASGAGLLLAAQSESPGGGGTSSDDLGAARETRVAELTNGRVASGNPGKPGLKITKPGVGSTDVDVFGGAGEYIAVGGPAKAQKLSDLGHRLNILKYAADKANVPAQAYFEAGTPQAAIDLARRKLGNDNVFIFER